MRLIFCLFLITSYSSMYSQICDDFTVGNWQSIDTLGYSQNGTYPILETPYFQDPNQINGWWFNGSVAPGGYGINSGVRFQFDGNEQEVELLIYGLYGQYNQMGFSVNGSNPIDLDTTFPITLMGIDINLDTSAIDSVFWENSYLTFSGEIDNIEYYAFEAGFIQLCTDNPLISSLNSKYHTIQNTKLFILNSGRTIRIESNQIGTVDIFNIYGNLVMSKNINLSSNMISTQELSNGIYIARYQTLTGLSKSIKFIRP